MVTVRSKALRIGLTDYQEEDDDRITVTLDTEERRAVGKGPQLLAVNAHLFNIPPVGAIMNAVPGDLRWVPGVNAYLSYGLNTITIRCDSAGRRGPCTLRVTLSKQDVLDGGNKIWFWDMMPGETRQFTLGFSQVHFSSAWPKSNQHVREAQALKYPRLVTIEKDEDAKRRRRKQSVITGYISRGFVNPDGSSYGPTKDKTEQYDEYPPASYPENNGVAHVKPIDKTDNEGSGALLGPQNKQYDVGDIVELVAD